MASAVLKRIRSQAPVTVLTPLGCFWILRAIDRLFRMRPADASWSMFSSLALLSLLTSAGPVSMVFGNPNGDDGPAAICIVIAPMMAYLAIREFAWLRRPRRLEPIA